MVNMKEKWKKEIVERYKTYFGDIEIEVGESTIEVKERRIKRTTYWEEKLQESLQPFFLHCDHFYAYTISQGSLTKSYAIEFCLDNVSYLLTIECKKGELFEKMYGKQCGKRSFQVLKEHKELKKECDIAKEKMEIFKETFLRLPEIRLRQLF